MSLFEDLLSRQATIDDSRIIQSLAEQARDNGTLAVQLERKLEDAERRIRELGTDAVTLLPTRLTCDEHVALAWQRSLRSEGAFGVLLIDVDYLKRINDEEGHAAGDDALRRIAMSIREAARRADFVGRWGGDEFIVVVEGATPAGLDATAERIHERVANEAPTSVSIGAALEGVWSEDVVSPGEIIEAADRDLLTVKKGRS